MLEELPRAQRLLKSFVDSQTAQLIEQSDALSQKYLAKREEFIDKRRTLSEGRAAIERLLRVLDGALKVPLSARKSISEVGDMNEQEIILKIEELNKLSQLFTEGEIQQQVTEAVKQQQLIDSESAEALQETSIADISELNSDRTQSQLLNTSSGVKHMKYLGMGMQFLQSFSCLMGIIAILSFYIF